MPNAVEVVKRAAVDAVEASRPVNVLFGTVLSEAPLQIKVSQKITLTEKMLVLTRNVTDFTVMETVDHVTENASGGSGDAAYESHAHPYVGKKPFLIHNALKTGEKVVLIRLQGGQKFLVLDRVGVGA